MIWQHCHRRTKHETRAGHSGQVFETLGTQRHQHRGAGTGSGRNQHFVRDFENDLRKSLNVIHDSFFLSLYQELNLFVVGTGTVGSKLLDQIRQQQQILKDRNKLRINIVGIANGRKALFREKEYRSKTIWTT